MKMRERFLKQILEKWNGWILREDLRALSDETLRETAEQLKEMEPDSLRRLFQKFQAGTRKKTGSPEAEELFPPSRNCLRLDTSQIFGRSASAQEHIQAGKAAVVILAGGMGSRLGCPAPKGTFPIMPVSGKTLFQVHFEKIAVLCRHYGTQLPIYIMTNRASHLPTIEYFREQNWFGTPESDIFFFPQAEMPFLDPKNGAFFWNSEGRICHGPDGHGGSIQALVKSGAAEDMHRRGIETINTFHVDNPLVPILNEQFLGAHLEQKSEMSSIVVEKKDGKELLGNLAERYTTQRHGIQKTLEVVEYLDFPEKTALQTDPDGKLKFWAGSIGIHLIQLSFLEKMAAQMDSSEEFLPYHLPLKKTMARDGEVWGIKPERFIFDVLPFAKTPIFACAEERNEVFATLKNDPLPVREHLSQLYASWLRQAGGTFPPNARVEIAPELALDVFGLKEKLPAGVHWDLENIYLDAKGVHQK